MRKVLFLFTIILLSSCASLDFQMRTLHTVDMYDGIYYNTPTRINSNFIFFQPNYYNNFWWNYSQTFPLNWNHFGSFGLTYNWRYNRWNSNQWLFNPYYDQFRIAPLYTPKIVRNRGRRSNTRVSIPRTPAPRTTNSIRNMNTRSTYSGTVGNTLNVRTPQPRRWRTRTNIQQRRNETPQPTRGRANQTQVRKPVYNRPSTPRARVTTPPPTPSNRNSTVRSNNRSTNGGRPIKQ